MDEMMVDPACTEFLERKILNDEDGPYQSPRRAASESSPFQSFMHFDKSSLEESTQLCLSPLKLGRKPSASDQPKDLLLAEPEWSRGWEGGCGHERDNLPALCYEQNGSRAVQQLLEEAGGDPALYEMLYPEAHRLVNHQFGNYVFQKMLDYFPRQRESLLDLVYAHFQEHARSQFGCRVVQRALQYTPVEGHWAEFLKGELARGFLGLVEDVHANHVVQKAFEIFGDRLPESFVESLVENVVC